MKNPGLERQDVYLPMLLASMRLPVRRTWGENMLWKLLFALTFCAAIAVPASAQSATESQTQSSICTLADGKQVTVRYTPVAANSKIDLVKGKTWGPGNEPMYLFTEAEVSFGGSDLAVGAYSIYVIPNGNKWTLIVNKDVSGGNKYDEKQDLAHTQMNSEQVSDAQPFSIVFAHLAPRQCSLQINYGRLTTTADFNEK
jgi:hypothetical protein